MPPLAPASASVCRREAESRRIEPDDANSPPADSVEPAGLAGESPTEVDAVLVLAGAESETSKLIANFCSPKPASTLPDLGRTSELPPAALSGRLIVGLVDSGGRELIVVSVTSGGGRFGTSCTSSSSSPPAPPPPLPDTLSSTAAEDAPFLVEGVSAAIEGDAVTAAAVDTFVFGEGGTIAPPGLDACEGELILTSKSMSSPPLLSLAALILLFSRDPGLVSVLSFAAAFAFSAAA